jgi:mono/diheme cytochrome c family protein
MMCSNSEPFKVFMLTLALALLLVGVGSALAADAAPSQCVACHTDAAKLKPLTPPDPPSTEEGEG